jgi:hypothetical protein
VNDIVAAQREKAAARVGEDACDHIAAHGKLLRRIVNLERPHGGALAEHDVLRAVLQDDEACAECNFDVLHLGGNCGLEVESPE